MINIFLVFPALQISSVFNACFSFSWTKDGVPLAQTADGMKVVADNGTLVIMFPGPDDEGLYQCSASTVFGIVTSVSVQLRQACMSS